MPGAGSPTSSLRGVLTASGLEQIASSSHVACDSGSRPARLDVVEALSRDGSRTSV